MLKGFTRKFKPLEILTDEQLQVIGTGTLDVLETTGIRVEHDRALQLFADHRCKVDFKQKRVRIPSDLVEESLRKCPSSFSLRARNPNNSLRVGGNTLHFTQSVGMRYVDPISWETRSATIQEHNEAIKILDALETVHVLVGQEFYLEMRNIPPCMVMLEGLVSGFRNSSKVQVMGYSQDCEIFAIKMARVLNVDLRASMSVSSPLTLHYDCCEAAFRFAEAGFPISISSGIAYGASGPATISGSSVTNNAEIIAGIVLVQLIRPGNSVLASDFGFPMDMRTGNPAFGDVAIALHNIIFEQYWHQYNIPTISGGFGYSSSKKIDFQNAYERAMNMLIAVLAGTNLPWLHGAVHGELTFSPIMAILDDDVAGWIGRFIEGVEVNNDTLAIDLIESVGPIPGQYLNTRHTREWWRREQFVPRVADREPYPEWVRKSKKDAIALAKERMADILAKHKPLPLDPEQNKALDEILKEARSFYRQKGLI